MENVTETKVKKRAKQNEDGLSSLPDCVLIHLMTFMTTKDSVRASVLSTRYKDLWKRVPSLVLSTRDPQFQRLAHFNKFVTKALTFRDGSVPLLNVDFFHGGRIPPSLLRRVLRYAVSHNIQHLKLCANCDFDWPHCIFSCQTLTSLDLSANSQHLFPKSLNLTALTSLRAQYFAFRAGEGELVEPFSPCVKLKTLVIENCNISNQEIFFISNATLVNLTIIASTSSDEAYRILLSTPNLCSFSFSGVITQQLTASSLSSLKEVNIDFDHWVAPQHSHSAFVLISWLQVFANMRSLTVCSNALKVLSLIPGLLNTESPCLDKLESLIVNVKNPSPLALFQKPRRVVKSKLKKAQLKPSSLVPDGVVDYLIRNSPFATVTLIYH